MPRALHKLTDRTAKSDRLKPGRHSDGGGLYLNVSPTGAKSWLFMWAVEKKRREMGIGSFPTVSLAAARKQASDLREAVAAGLDPIAERQRENEPTFGECADRFVDAMESQWRNEKHRAQWRMTLTDYCEPIRSKRVSMISTDDVLKVLTPIWGEKPETASRLRGRIERVLDYAKAKGWRSGENPALWRGHLKNVLPARQRLTRGHHEAMAYEAVPAFLKRIRELEAISARLLEFTILTAARSGETRLAVWSEIDMDAALWIVPAARMKAGKEHRVPLSRPALDILGKLHEARTGDLVFPGQKAGSPLSVMAMDMLLRRLKVDVTVHGFRSAFRDWAAEETGVAREVAEQALAHTIGNAVERAYRRGDALEKRRKLMDAWAGYLDRPATDNVLKLRA